MVTGCKIHNDNYCKLTDSYLAGLSPKKVILHVKTLLIEYIKNPHRT